MTAIVGVLAGLLASCESNRHAGVPGFSAGGLLRTATPVPDASLVALEGMFNVRSRENRFGEDIALRATRATLSILSGYKAGYAVLRAGCLAEGSRLVLEGYWRYPLAASTGLVRLELGPPAAASDARAGRALSIPSSELTFDGVLGEGEDETPGEDLGLGFARPLLPYRGTLFTIGHLGACESADDCGASANSLPSFALAEDLGANAAEMDVRITRDGVPIILHDPVFSSADARGLFCQGAVPDRTFAEIRANCGLPKGELVPTLEEALSSVIDGTTLEAVYMDMKVPEALEGAVARKANETARAKGRAFSAVVALTKEEITAEWDRVAATGVPIPPCLVEYSLDEAMRLGCVPWAPTWTEVPEPKTWHARRPRARWCSTGP